MRRLPGLEQLANRVPVPLFGPRDDELDAACQGNSPVLERFHGEEGVGERSLVILGTAADEAARLARGVENKRIPRPLGRFVRCAACSNPLTGSWSRGRAGRRYAYYRCPSCSRLSIGKERLETLFLELLDKLQPKPEYLQALKESVLEIWQQRQSEVAEFKKVRQKRKVCIEERKHRLVEAFVYQQEQLTPFLIHPLCEFRAGFGPQQ